MARPYTLPMPRTMLSRSSSRLIPRPIQGFIPTGWYPTAVALSADDRQLGIASGYGFGSLAPTPADRKGRSYKDRVGVVSVLDLPTRGALTVFYPAGDGE